MKLSSYCRLFEEAARQVKAGRFGAGNFGLWFGQQFQPRDLAMWGYAATSAPNHGGYGAAKAGMINLVRTMANEWGQYGIRVNAAMPGSCATPRLDFGEAGRAKMKEMLPLGRAAEPDELAKALVFLVSDLASYVTGDNLRVDGGWTSRFLMQSSIGAGAHSGTASA